MFNLINGLPIHPLVVHAVVVLLPLAILGTIAIALRPAWREKYGHLVLFTSVVAIALIPVATSSGESLEKHVGDPGVHAHLGDQLIWFAIPLLILNAALLFLGRFQSQRRGVIVAVATLSVLASVAAGVQVYRVGDSGARAAWADQISTK